MDNVAKATATLITKTADVAANVEQHPIKSAANRNSSALTSFSALTREPAFVVLSSLFYIASVSWYFATSGVRAASTSETYVWVVCIPYTVLVIDKLLTTIRAMQVEEQTYNEMLQELEAGDREKECDQHGGRDTLTIVGDVCVNVIGVLLLGYLLLPWELLRCSLSIELL
jgi:hypothetical protein